LDRSECSYVPKDDARVCQQLEDLDTEKAASELAESNISRRYYSAVLMKWQKQMSTKWSLSLKRVRKKKNSPSSYDWDESTE
jgi:hypothetical protein